MRTSLDAYLGIHPQALALEAQRNELLAANIANVDTPNYKARDIDFKAALAAASGSPGAAASSNAASSSAASSAASSSTLSLRATNAAAQYGGNAAAAPAGSGGAIDPALLKYRVPMAPALDGNTVDEQLEQAAFAENSVRYQASLTFMSAALKDLMTAITGS
jgi:flagellar basal-body rod protein FlgB